MPLHHHPVLSSHSFLWVLASQQVLGNSYPRVPNMEIRVENRLLNPSQDFLADRAARGAAVSSPGIGLYINCARRLRCVYVTFLYPSSHLPST